MYTCASKLQSTRLLLIDNTTDSTIWLLNSTIVGTSASAVDRKIQGCWPSPDLLVGKGCLPHDILVTPVQPRRDFLVVV